MYECCCVITNKEFFSELIHNAQIKEKIIPAEKDG
jgi:hypothetical protein